MQIIVDIPEEVIDQYLLTIDTDFKYTKSMEEQENAVYSRLGQVLAEHFVPDQETVFF